MQLATGTAVVLVYEEAGEACALPGPAKVKGVSADALHIELSPVPHAIATFAGTTGAVRVAAADEALADCIGLPDVNELHAPAFGMAFGLARPAIDAAAEGTAGAASVGSSDWWVVFPDPTCTPPCRGEIALTHAEGAPTLFTVHLAAESGPKPLDVHLPPGGAAVLKVTEGAAWYWPSDELEIVDLGTSLLVMSAAEVSLDGFVRLDDDVPRPVHLDAMGGWGQAKAEPEVSVRTGKKRAFKLDRDVVQTWVADGSVASASVSGRRLKVSGLAEGRTHVAFDDGSGDPRLVRVVVTP